jgi:phosphotransferase system enzyme I (PtsP)
MAHLTRHGHQIPSTLKLGAMIEVPALLFDLDRLFERVDFASVGSNDLLQFLTASDRGNTRLAGRFDALSRPFMRALAAIVEAAERHRKPVTLCGEIAGHPLEALALLALGYRSISMSPSSIGPVKEMIRSVELGRVAPQIREVILGEGPCDDLRKRVAAIAAEGGLTI